MGKVERFNYLIILLISGLTVFDLFFNHGQPATMDGTVHIASIAQFTDALRQGQFPVIWLNNFANYGLPVGLFSHQIPLYVGAFVNFLTNNPVLSSNVVTLIGVVAANLLFYKFARVYVSSFSALLGTLLFSVAPYRILNIYIRGAIPETFSAFLLPLILLSLYALFSKNRLAAFFLLILSFAALTLTHPMMLLIYSFFIFPYFVFLLLQSYKRENRQIRIKDVLSRVGFFFAALGIGVGMGSYYILPLILEKKYFYFGQYTNLLTNDFLNLSNFISERWAYFYKDNVFTRGHIVQLGLPETVIIIFSVVLLLVVYLQRKQEKNLSIFVVVLLIGLIGLFFTTSLAVPLYQLLSPLQNIQFPWRMLSVVIFIPPLLLALLTERIKKKTLIAGLVLLIVAFRIPQLYGKNFTIQPNSYYDQTKENLHSVNMNTVWTGRTQDYPDRPDQVAIIDGTGTITPSAVTHTLRESEVVAQTPLRVVDYTFYFPGWNVYLNGSKVPIEFQDPDYRGVITYSVPKGKHIVKTVFEDTAVRRYAKLLSVGFVVLVLGLYLLRKQLETRFAWGTRLGSREGSTP